ncbi:MAG: glutathione peroxidase [Spirochaetia bacterium]
MSMEGNPVPSVTFKTRQRSIHLIEVSTDRIFKGKKVVFFALPGAFTPTCTMEHIPRYEQLFKMFKEKGIDEVVCLAVNDPFVMERFGEDLGIHNVRLLPDGNGEFTKAMGMGLDLSAVSASIRSKRYSMYVVDGIIKKIFAEKDNDPPGQLSVSDADSMYAYLFPTAPKLLNISMIVLPGCPDCAKMKMIFDTGKVPYEELRYGYEVNGTTLKALTGEKRFPQIFIDGKHVDPNVYLDGRSLKMSPDLLSAILSSIA